MTAIERKLELSRARNRKYYWKNPKAVRARKKANGEARLASMTAEELAIYKKRRADIHRRSRDKNPERRREIKHASYLRHREATRKQQRKRYALRNYGLTLDAIASMLDSQKGVCAICATTTPGGHGTWKIDHDHKTGKVRGLLCNNCNLALGHMKDDPHLFRNAAQYLESQK